MHTPAPLDLDDATVATAVTAGWGRAAFELRYLPVGGGAYHWRLVDAAGDAWFVTVDDLDTKEWLGPTRDEVAVGLEACLTIARWLRDEASLGFVSVPVVARDGRTTQRLGDRYTVSLSPFLDGESHPFGPHTDPARRRRVLDTLIALHTVDPPTGVLDRRRPTIGRRADLDDALRDTNTVLAAHVDELIARLDAFDRAAPAIVAARCVTTHGEPHAGNVLTVGDADLLIDWDTVGLAVPERDLWFFADDHDGLQHYADATGHRPDPHALALYRVRWQFDDLGHAVHAIRHPGDETEQAIAALPSLLDDILATPPLR